MHVVVHTLRSSILTLAFVCCAAGAAAQPAGLSRWSFDAGVGLDISVNGNVNSGAIGTLNGQAAAILPNPYGEVYGTGVQLRFGVGYGLDDEAEVRAALTFQSGDADLVRMGDIGPSSLYGQYSDYQTLGLEFGYRRYIPLRNTQLRLFGEGMIGMGFIDAIDVVLAAPQANIVFDDTDFFDQTAAFMFGFGVGALFPVAEKVDVSLQVGLRRVSGLAEVDQLVGTGLEEINNDSARLTFPIIVGARFRF